MSAPSRTWFDDDEWRGSVSSQSERTRERFPKPVSPEAASQPGSETWPGPRTALAHRRSPILEPLDLWTLLRRRHAQQFPELIALDDFLFEQLFRQLEQ